ncbi:MAG: response regulator [Nitrospiria bacterium]
MSAQILVVDQNPVIQTTIENTLSAQKYEVTCVRDALSGLDLAYKIKPDLIIADMRMEGLMIYSFCARIRQKAFLSHIPIFLLIQQNDVYDEAKLRQSGVVGFIKKPIDGQILNESLRPYLERFSENIPDTPLSPLPENPVKTNGIEKTEDTLDHDQMVFERTVMDAVKTEEPSLPAEDTVRIEDLLGWPADEVSPFSEVISSPASDETQISGFSQVMEQSPLTETSLTTSSAETVMDTLKGDMGVSTEFDVTKTKIDSPALVEKPIRKPEEILSQNGKLNLHTAPSPSIPVSSGGIKEDVTKAAQEIIEKVAWEVVPHLTEQVLKKEAIAAMIEKVIWDVVPSIAEKSIREAIKKITEESE